MLALEWAGDLSWVYSACNLNSTQNTKNVMLHGKENDKEKHAFPFKSHDYWFQQESKSEFNTIWLLDVI